MNRKITQTISDSLYAYNTNNKYTNIKATKTAQSQQNMDILFTQTQHTFHDIFKRVQKSKMAQSFDAEFGNFDMPKIAEWSQRKSTPSNIIFGTDGAIIKLSELTKYEEILAKAKKKSKMLHKLNSHMNHINEEIQKRFMDTKIVYRGMGIVEFSTMSKMNGNVGLHHRVKYAASNDFVSCSIDADEAALFGTEKKKRGLVVRMDVSQMKMSDYAPIKYEIRRNIRVTDRGKHVFNPYEMFGANQTGSFMNEREIHLRNGSRPIIMGVDVYDKHPAEFIKRLGMTTKALEVSQRQKIKIKYVIK